MNFLVAMLFVFNIDLFAEAPNSGAKLKNASQSSQKIASSMHELKKEKTLAKVLERIEEIADSYRQGTRTSTDGDFIDLFAPDLLNNIAEGESSWRDCWVYFIEFQRKPERQTFISWKSCVLSFVDAKYLPAGKAEYLQIIEKLLPITK